MALEHLRITDYSDREFLLVLEDVADADGWASSQEVADRLDLAHRRIASSRLSWMKRLGQVEREIERDDHGNLRTHRDGKPVYTQRWCLTDEGFAYAHATLRKGDESALARMRDEQMLLLTRYLTERTNVSEVQRRMVEREWRFGHARRNGR